MKTVIPKFSVVILTLFCFNPAVTARMTPEEYIERYKGIAISEMTKHGIPASITLAQGGLESSWGASELALNANNHFGIKCHGWQGATYRKDAEMPKECFRKYDSPEQSYHDHSLFLRYRERYSFLFTLKSNDYKGWANGLLSAGYSTNPKYASLLINLIEKYGLNRYDRTESNRTHPMMPDLEVNNGIQCIVACTTDTYADLAKRYHVYKSDLKRYNEVPKKEVKPKSGSIVYFDWKKSRAGKGFETHIVSEGETYYDISQLYGIRLKSLYKFNGVSKGDIPSPGDIVYLRRKRKK